MADTNGKALTIDEILAADDIDIERVNCPRWGGAVYLRTISGNERDRLDQKFSAVDGNVSLEGFRAAWVAACLCDDKGKRQEISENQLIALGRKSCAELDRCFAVCQRLNRVTAEDVEAALKNSSSPPVVDSG